MRLVSFRRIIGNIVVLVSHGGIASEDSDCVSLTRAFPQIEPAVSTRLSTIVTSRDLSLKDRHSYADEARL